MTPEEKQMREVMQVVAEQVAGFLTTLHPAVAKVDKNRIANAAQAAAMDLPQFQPLVGYLSDPDCRYRLKFELLQLGLIDPKPVKVLEFASPIRLERCANPNEVLSSLTLLSLLLNDSVRALLYFHGYRCNWQVVAVKGEELQQ